MSKITDDKRAQRAARVIASDLSLYHEDEVVAGIVNDDLFERLGDEIEKGREHYESRVADELVERENFYEIALVNVLIQNKGHVKSEIW
jgi:hypothetical protein